MIFFLRASGLALCLTTAALPADAPATPQVLRGTWVLDAEGKPSPRDEFIRGLQPSGLVFRKGELWSVGDQRGEHPAHLLRLDPKTVRLIGKPILLELPPRRDGEGPEYEEYRSIPRRNPDYEGLAVVPADPGRLIAITEDKTPLLVDIQLDESGSTPRARIAHLTRVVFPEGLKAWRDDPNYRFEGCAVSDDSATVYLAFERAYDELPRIYETTLERATSGSPVTPTELSLPFSTIPKRKDKEVARLNMNDIQFFRLDGRAALLAVLRDQERLCLIDLDRKEIPRILDIDFKSPDGGAIEWASPEGIALDPATDRLWIINDPDSVFGNYKARGAAPAAGPFADYTPLLFEMKISALEIPKKS